HRQGLPHRQKLPDHQRARGAGGGDGQLRDQRRHCRHPQRRRAARWYRDLNPPGSTLPCGSRQAIVPALVVSGQQSSPEDVMAQNRSERQTPLVNQTPVLIETLRQASESCKPKEEDKEERKVPLFWRIFGGTTLSIVSLVVMSAYQSLSGGLADVRQEM